MILRNKKKLKVANMKVTTKQKRIPLLVHLLKLKHEEELDTLKKENDLLQEEIESLCEKILHLEEQNSELEERLDMAW